MTGRPQNARSSAFDPQVNDLLSRMAMPRYARGHVSPVFLYSVTIPMGILCSDMCDHRDLWRSCAANARLIHVLEADLRILVLRGSVMEIMGSGHNNTVLHNRNSESPGPISNRATCLAHHSPPTPVAPISLIESPISTSDRLAVQCCALIGRVHTVPFTVRNSCRRLRLQFPTAWFTVGTFVLVAFCN